ncbi:hypothetical protein FN846DRAFT_902125 [Sphaerosporella brunnea]|uniref:Uncharacterized protein n=1 Tax=Sphaerosporella brunnea TaxID=1250544 RepID=A0A5J5FA71_9PEZI|nr:hypothetical protein FN846DRAFT_902125 [Sphaerosporella brunnea]
MPPKLILKGIFDEAGLDSQTGIILHRYIMRVCRQNSWHNKTGFWRDAMFKETERPAILRTIANKIRLYEIYPELYTQPLHERRLYRFVDGLFRYGQRSREGSWYRQLPPPPAVQTDIVLTVDWETGAPGASPPLPPPPPPPAPSAGPAISAVMDPQLSLNRIETSLDALPKHITDTITTELDARLGKRKLRCCCGGCCDHDTDRSEKRTRL